MRQLDINKPVMLTTPGSSFGRITGNRDDLGDHHTVTWYYGTDNSGEPWTAQSHGKKLSEFINIDEQLFAKFIKCRAFNPEQKKIADEIVEKVRQTDPFANAWWPDPNKRTRGDWMGQDLKDAKGRTFEVGDRIVRAVTSGRAVNLEFATVGRIENGKLYLGDSHVPINYPGRLLIINEVPDHE